MDPDQHKEEIRQLKEQRAIIEKQLTALNPNAVHFSVDASLIDRLGNELVGRAVTAVAELVKNAYDADATAVILDFQETLTKDMTLQGQKDSQHQWIEVEIDDTQFFVSVNKA